MSMEMPCSTLSVPRVRNSPWAMIGANGAEDHHDLAFAYCEVESVQHADRAVTTGQLLDAEQLRTCAGDAFAGHCGVPRYASITSGLSRISSGLPSAIWDPKSSTTILSEMPMTIAMWCST